MSTLASLLISLGLFFSSVHPVRVFFFGKNSMSDLSKVKNESHMETLQIQRLEFGTRISWPFYISVDVLFSWGVFFPLFVLQYFQQPHKETWLYNIPFAKPIITHHREWTYTKHNICSLGQSLSMVYFHSNWIKETQNKPKYGVPVGGKVPFSCRCTTYALLE